MTAARISHSCQRLAGSTVAVELATAEGGDFTERPWICLEP
jgi:hypothetical protein